MVGSCLLRGWSQIVKRSRPGCPCDSYIINYPPELPSLPERPLDDYDFQVVQLPLRSVLPDRAYFRLAYQDERAYDDLFAESAERLSRMLEGALKWNRAHGLLSFVLNFAVPQMNPMGRFMPRYSYRNLTYFVERLNETLSNELDSYSTAHSFDLDQLINTFGKKYFCDDSVWQTNHASALRDVYLDDESPPALSVGSVSDYYPTRVQHFVRLAWKELVAMYRTSLNVDAVRLVVVDLDDTLWRGVAGEGPDIGPEDVEGWPLGVVEALGCLKRRGIMLAVMSRNSEAKIRETWERTIFSRRLSLDDFAVLKINFKQKVENLGEILRATNVLPRYVVVVDDNVVERAAIERAFPDVRTLGSDPLVLRRELLWSPETQVTAITSESAGRTRTAQVRPLHESFQANLARSAFLADLGLTVTPIEVRDVNSPKIARALELLNRTNQFNTTAERWTEQRALRAIQDGVVIWSFDVRDRYQEYGIAAVALVDGTMIQQLAVSCRVLGLDVDRAVIAFLVGILGQSGDVRAHLLDTGDNWQSREALVAMGFTQRFGMELRRRVDAELPSMNHVSIRYAEQDNC
jgi:FkbH-like protein